MSEVPIGGPTRKPAVKSSPRINRGPSRQALLAILLLAVATTGCAQFNADPEAAPEGPRLSVPDEGQDGGPPHPDFEKGLDAGYIAGYMAGYEEGYGQKVDWEEAEEVAEDGSQESEEDSFFIPTRQFFNGWRQGFSEAFRRGFKEGDNQRVKEGGTPMRIHRIGAIDPNGLIAA